MHGAFQSRSKPSGQLRRRRASTWRSGSRPGTRGAGRAKPRIRPWRVRSWLTASAPLASAAPGPGADSRAAPGAARGGTWTSGLTAVPGLAGRLPSRRRRAAEATWTASTPAGAARAPEGLREPVDSRPADLRTRGGRLVLIGLDHASSRTTPSPSTSQSSGVGRPGERLARDRGVLRGVAAYIRGRTPGSVPTVTQHLAAIRMLGDWFVVSQVPVNPRRGRPGTEGVVTKGRRPGSPAGGGEEAPRINRHKHPGRAPGPDADRRLPVPASPP